MNNELVRNYRDIRKNIETGSDSERFEQVIDARPEAR